MNQIDEIRVVLPSGEELYFTVVPDREGTVQFRVANSRHADPMLVDVHLSDLERAAAARRCAREIRAGLKVPGGRQKKGKPA